MLLDQRRLRDEAAHHEERALTDTLTGPPNREALRRSMEDAFDRPRTQAALLFMDLDRFKPSMTLSATTPATWSSRRSPHDCWHDPRR